MPRSLLLLAFAPLIASGCRTTRVFANADPSADFAIYRTYGFLESLGTDGGPYGSLLSQFLKEAAAEELEERGYRPADEPDLLVNFFVHTEERVHALESPRFPYGYHGYGWGGLVGYETHVRRYVEDTLQIDLVDRARGQVVWEAVVVGPVSDRARDHLRAWARWAVERGFAKYPYGAEIRSRTP